MQRSNDRVIHTSAPGRTEIAGNHTDHQGGRVIAAAIDRYVEISLCPSDDLNVFLDCREYGSVSIQLDPGTSQAALMPRSEENATTAALVRGVLAGFATRGVSLSGFSATVNSTIPPGGGLSSSAAFEMALARALNAAFANKRLSSSNLIDIACEAERTHFGKPCGQMDQTAIELGGINLMDFSSDSPAIERVDFDFEEAGYRIFLIDTHTDHSSCTAEYAQIPEDMTDVSLLLGASVLSQVPVETFFERFAHLRRTLGDRSALRALHYYNEMRLVDIRAQALRAHDMDSFLRATRESCLSSGLFLQNISVSSAHEQPVSIALGLAEYSLDDAGAVRIHGGGFGGYIQAFVPLDRAESFAAFMDRHLGDGSSLPVAIVNS